MSWTIADQRYLEAALKQTADAQKQFAGTDNRTADARSRLSEMTSGQTVDPRLDADESLRAWELVIQGQPLNRSRLNGVSASSVFDPESQRYLSLPEQVADRLCLAEMVVIDDGPQRTTWQHKGHLGKMPVVETRQHIAETTQATNKATDPRTWEREFGYSRADERYSDAAVLAATQRIGKRT